MSGTYSPADRKRLAQQDMNQSKFALEENRMSDSDSDASSECDFNDENVDRIEITDADGEGEDSYEEAKSENVARRNHSD